MRYSGFAFDGRAVSKLGFGAMGFAGWFGPRDEGEGVRALHYALRRHLRRHRTGLRQVRGRQLLPIRPDLVDLYRLDDVHTSPLRRFAQGADAGEATAEQGRAILEHSLARLHHLVDLDLHRPFPEPVETLSIQTTEEIWQRVAARRDEWSTSQERDPLPGVLASAAEIGLR
jgi:hypothetical protein